MSKDDSRLWNFRLNLDDFNAVACSLFLDSDRALVLQGMALGMNGGDAPHDAPRAFVMGYELGAKMRQEAVEFRAEQSIKGRKSADARAAKNQPLFEPRFEPRLEPELDPLFEPNDNPQSTNLNPLNPRAKTRAQPPTKDEWVAYCIETWPDWNPESAEDSHAYYASVGWRTKAGPIKDWRAAARTSYGNAKAWGKLQPKGSAIQPPTLDEWIEEGKSLNRSAPRGTPEWSWEACEAVWHDNQAKGWRFVQDWRACILAAYNRFLGNERQFADRRR